MHPSRGGDTARGRPVGGPGDRAGLPGCADAWRSRAVVGAVARSRGSDPHSRPAPGSRTRRGRTPSRTPPRGTAPCATAWLWRSHRPASPPAPGRDGGDRPPGVSRTAARVPVGCDHAYTDPGVLAIARARDHRDERLSVGESRRARAWRQATATPRASGVTASPPGERRLATLRRGWHARAPRQDPRAGGRQPQREEQLPEQRERRHRFGLRFRFGLGFGHLHADVRRLTGRPAPVARRCVRRCW